MDKKFVTKIPLSELWNEAGLIAFERSKLLKADEIKDLIASEALHFVVADVGQPLKWIAKQERFNFWKSELKEHLCENPKGCFREDFKDEYCYYAYLWISKTERLIVVEKYH